MTDSPPLSNPQPHPLYNIPSANRSASSYDSAENGIPDGPPTDSTYAALSKSGNSSSSPADPSSSSSHHLNTTGSGARRNSDTGAIDLGDDADRGGRRSYDADGKVKLGRTLAPRSPGLAPSEGFGGLTPRRVGKAIGLRGMRAVRRGNLPFLFVFLTCLIVFFSALAGIGYVPDEADLIARGSISPSSPGLSYDERQVVRGKQNAAQRELEQEWAKKKRPKSGAWMEAVRDDRSVRRRPAEGAKEVKRDVTKDALDEEEPNRDEFEADVPAEVLAEEPEYGQAGRAKRKLH